MEQHVMSVLGSVSSNELGYVLLHEHLFVDLRCYWSPEQDESIAYAPLSLDLMERVQANPFASRDNLLIDEPFLLAQEFRMLDGFGMVTVVDVTPSSIGRDALALRWLAKQTGVNIVTGCGYYVRPSHPHGMASRTVDEIASELIRELSDGIDETDVRAGVIGEIGMATSPVHPMELNVIRAAVMAHEETGAAIVMHSAPGDESPFEVVELLESMGADMTRVVQSHLDERFRNDVNKYRRIAESGANIGLDTFGRELYFASLQRQHPTDDQRVEIVLMLIEAGLIDHIIISQDICFKHELSGYGGRGYSHVLSRIAPLLRSRGVSERELDQILRANPVRILAG